MGAASSQTAYADYKESVKREPDYTLTRVGGLWNMGTVPYTIGFNCPKLERLVDDAVRTSNAKLKNVQWVKKNTSASKYWDNTYYVEFCMNNDKNPSSYVGCCRKERQTINLCSHFPKSRREIQKGNILHEMLHALGFEHEHSRSDRDDYVTVNEEAISEDEKHNYSKSGVPFGDYDFDSIMHYGKSNRLKCKDKANDPKIGNRKNLSQIDIDSINEVYENEFKKKVVNTRNGRFHSGSFTTPLFSRKKIKKYHRGSYRSYHTGSYRSNYIGNSGMAGIGGLVAAVGGGPFAFGLSTIIGASAARPRWSCCENEREYSSGCKSDWSCCGNNLSSIGCSQRVVTEYIHGIKMWSCCGNGKQYSLLCTRRD